MRGSFSAGFAGAVADIRQKLLEEGWFGKAVTPRQQNITIGAPGEQSPGEQLGWWRRDERVAPASDHIHDRDAALNEPKALDRDIDL